jgi:hypothetical protein
MTTIGCREQSVTLGNRANLRHASHNLDFLDDAEDREEESGV